MRYSEYYAFMHASECFWCLYISNKLYCFDAGRGPYLELQLLLLLRAQQHGSTLHRYHRLTLALVARDRMRQLLGLTNMETALLTLLCRWLWLLLLDELELLLLGRIDVDCGQPIYREAVHRHARLLQLDQGLAQYRVVWLLLMQLHLR